MTTKENEPYEIVDPETGKPIQEEKRKPGRPKKEDKQASSEGKPEFEMPEKFQGKSAEEIAKSYMERQDLFDKQAQELGEMRKSVSAILERELKQSKDSEEAKKMEADLEYEELVDNPTESIRKAVSPELEAVRKELNQLKTNSALEKFTAKHPDYMELANQVEFQNWVKASTFRTRMYVAADGGDYQAADELFTEYKSMKPAPKEDDNADREKALKGQSSESGSGQGTAKKKYYRQSDLINLRLKNPNALRDNPDITAAYYEGRVIMDLDNKK